MRIWNVLTKRADMVLAQHTDAIACVKWGGEGLIYTASRDKTIKVWDDQVRLIIVLSILIFN